MNEFLKGLLTIIVFVILQSFILALFAAIIWTLFLSSKFDINLGYIQWFAIIFISNILRFDFVEKINNSNKLLDTINKQTKNNKENKNEIQ
jgi:hypothetical protein